MVLPLIPLALIASGALTGSAGVAAGGRGAHKMHQARRDVSAATRKYERARTTSEKRARATNEQLRAHGQVQEDALRAVVGRMSEFIRRNQRQVNETLKLLVDGVDVHVNELGPSESLQAEALSLLAGVAGAGATGAGAAAGATGVVTAVGVASTGTAIGSLSGAAAESATLAWLGGGSLASGGGGVALGATALNFVTVGPALLVGGLVLNTQGEKALTKACKYVADAEVSSRKLLAMGGKFEAVDRRVEELQGILADLVEHATVAMDQLEAVDFDSVVHAPFFQRAIGLTVAVRAVATTPPVDDEGDLNERGADFKVKYREYLNDQQ